MRFHKLSLFIFTIIFLIEVSIALWIDDSFIRPFVGDVLVMPLIYTFVLIFMEISPVKLGIGVLLFAFAVEFAQYFKIIYILGLQDNALARIVIGTSFSTHDLIAYIVGIIITVFIHLRLQKTGSK